uniref:Thioredoxin domain-containing protein n=1 Tax=Hemiselmis andersenii TaxID=464988 RepID=A0A6U4J0F9_HEMAN|mmetsp:Transcript_33775/g.79121  ORF Transcript_33775/g.79121 Transcript_33775/m.79121 type:complete len:219 (+) Transcript_33775:99-755(+)
MQRPATLAASVVIATLGACLLFASCIPHTHAADAGTCGLRPPSEDTHPTDLNADGKTTPEEFAAYAEAQAAGGGEAKMDADGDGKVTTEEFVQFAEQQASGPVDLTPENFNEKTQNSKAAFVKFMAPWCGHCQTMAKPWNDLATKIHTEYNDVTIGTINCDTQKEFCAMFEIQSLPTLLLMKNPEAFEDATPLLYQDERDLDTMLRFLNEQGVLAPAA